MSIVNSIRQQFVPITPEGYPFIGAFALVALLLFWIWPPLGWLGTVADPVVRLLLPRSAAGDAGARRPRRRAGRRPHQPDHHRRAAARARHGRDAAAAHLDLHERVRLPREPQPGRGPRREDRLHARQVLQRRPRQGERRQRAQFAGHRHLGRAAHRRDADRRPRRPPHRLLRARNPAGRRRRALRHDPLRLAPRRLSA